MSQTVKAGLPEAPSVARNRPLVALIAAVARNGVIGARGGMPWHLPGDLKHFRRMTLGASLVMGRRTHESLGRRALPGRRNIVLTRDAAYTAPGCETATSLEAALACCAGETLLWVIGGGELYAAALPLAHRLSLTEIDRDYEGDTRFPPFDRLVWRERSRSPQRSPEGLVYAFVEYERDA